MGISVTQLLIVLVIVIVLFGTKRLRNMGGDLGGAVKGFRSAMKDGEGDKHRKWDRDTDQNCVSGAQKEEQNRNDEDKSANNVVLQISNQILYEYGLVASNYDLSTRRKRKRV